MWKRAMRFAVGSRSNIGIDFEGSARSDCEGSNSLLVWISNSRQELDLESQRAARATFNQIERQLDLYCIRQTTTYVKKVQPVQVRTIKATASCEGKPVWK